MVHTISGFGRFYTKQQLDSLLIKQYLNLHVKILQLEVHCSNYCVAFDKLDTDKIMWCENISTSC